MISWNELSDEVKAAIVAYYEKRYDVIGIVAVKNALTQECFERAIDSVLSGVRKRSRRQKIDTANKYEPTDVEMVAKIQIKIDASVAAGETRLLLYDVDNVTVERVTVDTVDSGGLGFKLLRIPN